MGGAPDEPEIDVTFLDEVVDDALDTAEQAPPTIPAPAPLASADASPAPSDEAPAPSSPSPSSPSPSSPSASSRSASSVSSPPVPSSSSLPSSSSRPSSPLPASPALPPSPSGPPLGAPKPAASGPSPDAPVVLVVDDDAAIRQMIVRAVATRYTVYEAIDGQHAWEILERIPAPACIVSDVMMPRLDGLALAKKVKASPSLKWSPIVFLTAKNAPMDVVQGINAGARHYLAKPFKVKELLEKVASVVKTSR